MSTSKDLKEVLNNVVKIVKDCGKIIRENIDSKDKNVTVKSMRTDLVTKVDKDVEKYFVEKLKTLYPDHKVIGEEGTSENNEGPYVNFTDNPTWIIDPIDGTMNYVHSNPMVSTSVAMTIKKKLVIGIVYLPILDQLYTAIRGQGAYKNGQKIKVSDCELFMDCLLSIEFGGSQSDEKKEFSKVLRDTALAKASGVRAVGSAAIDLAYVAAGHVDAYLDSGLHCWDIAAGALIVHEAGGTILSPSGEEFDIMGRGILATATPKLAQEMLKLELPFAKFERDFPDKCPM